MRCASVKKKGSTEQCSAKSVFGHTLCGRHVRCKNPVVWLSLYDERIGIIVKIQASVRGWYVRHRLRLAGPGVLHRTDLTNDDELVSGEEKEKQDPFQYFAFEENGKIWWFDFDSLWKWSLQSLTPSNPYTKTSLSKDIRIRMREMWGFRQRHQLGIPEESGIFEDRVLGRWNIICQIFTDNGFGDFRPEEFARMQKNDYNVVFRMIYDDIQVTIPNSHPAKQSIINLCHRAHSVFFTLHTRRYILQSVYTLLLMLSKPKEQYVIAFTVLSALARC